MNMGQMEWGKFEHLSYLDKQPESFRDKESKIQKINLVCAHCQNSVTTVSERTEIWGSHDYTFGNLGYKVKLGCFLNAPGSKGVKEISYGYSWFRGYVWQIQLCQGCNSQLGWKYISPEDSFYGLIFGTLEEQEPGPETEDNSSVE